MTALALPIVAQSWPINLCPSDCEFGRSRNDLTNVSPYSRTESIIRRGRPLWTSKCTWTVAQGQNVRDLRYYLDGLQGSVGSVLMWDFKNPNLSNANAVMAMNAATPPAIVATRTILWSAGLGRYRWGGSPGGIFNFSGDAIATLGQSAVSVSFDPSVYGRQVLWRGDYIQLKRRLYIVADDVTVPTDGTNAVVTLTTPVLDTLVSGDAIAITKASCEMRMAKDPVWTSRRQANQGYETCVAEFIETSRNVAIGGQSFAA